MRKEIIEIICDTLYLKENEIKDSTLLDDIIENSIDVIELIAVLSNKYNLSIKPQEMNEIKKIKDLIAYIDKNKKNEKNISNTF